MCWCIDDVGYVVVFLLLLLVSVVIGILFYVDNGLYVMGLVVDSFCVVKVVILVIF